MAWIETINFDAAEGPLRKLLERVAGPDGNVDNILAVHGLRPHTLEGHMALYKRVLHHTGNTVPKWFLETLGVQTSLLNACDYCVEHHAAGLARLVGAERAGAIRRALESNEFENTFDAKQRLALDYAHRLTLGPAGLAESDIRVLREAGWTDGEILEINQVCAYFAYANRTVLGLGVDSAGDVLGLSPSDGADESNWGHR